MRTLVHIKSDDTDRLVAMLEVFNSMNEYTLLTIDVKGDFTYFKIDHAYSWEIFDLGILVHITQCLNDAKKNL